MGGPLAAAALILFTLGAAGVSADQPETQRVTVDARGVVHPHGGARPGGGSGEKAMPCKFWRALRPSSVVVCHKSWVLAKRLFVLG